MKNSGLTWLHFSFHCNDISQVSKDPEWPRRYGPFISRHFRFFDREYFNSHGSKLVFLLVHHPLLCSDRPLFIFNVQHTVYQIKVVNSRHFGYLSARFHKILQKLKKFLTCLNHDWSIASHAPGLLLAKDLGPDKAFSFLTKD